MSLINKVLKQLENKPQNLNTDSSLSPAPNFSSRSTSTNSKKILLLVTLIIIFLLVLIISIVNKNSKTKNQNTKEHISLQINKTKNAPLVNKNGAAPLQPKTLPAQAPIRLNNISVSALNNKTTIRFELSQNTIYYLEHDDTQKHLTLTLSNTGIQTKPALNLNHTAVQSLTTKQDANNTIIYLDVLPETQVIGLQFYQQPKPELQLVLLNSMTPQGIVNKSVAPLSADQIADQKYQKALDFISNNEPDEAISELKEGLQKNPKNKKIRETLATLLIANNNPTEASHVLKQGLEITPYYPKFAELEAYVYVQQGKTNQAIASLEQNSPDFSSNPKYYALLANLYQKTGAFMQAARIYDQLTKVDPGNGMWWIGLGIAFESAHKNNAAIEAYQNASYTPNLTPELRSFVDDKLKNR